MKAIEGKQDEITNTIEQQVKNKGRKKKKKDRTWCMSKENKEECKREGVLAEQEAKKDRLTEEEDICK